jgi:hypothetical protein
MCQLDCFQFTEKLLLLKDDTFFILFLSHSELSKSVIWISGIRTPLNSDPETHYYQTPVYCVILLKLIEISSWRRDLPEKPVVTQLVKKFAAFYGTQNLLPCSQELGTESYSAPVEFSPHPSHANSLRFILNALFPDNFIGLRNLSYLWGCYEARMSEVVASVVALFCDYRIAISVNFPTAQESSFRHRCHT